MKRQVNLYVVSSAKPSQPQHIQSGVTLHMHALAVIARDAGTLICTNITSNPPGLNPQSADHPNAHKINATSCSQNDSAKEDTVSEPAKQQAATQQAARVLTCAASQTPLTAQPAKPSAVGPLHLLQTHDSLQASVGNCCATSAGAQRLLEQPRHTRPCSC